ncbi:hypothetical protein K502DRAFT_368250 [Neoconidiobolus thromboides FSU 785]|nr:hypothetical protein K502DRAFT_368250 [Neoconidiobolus thromboides FSU 785]
MSNINFPINYEFKKMKTLNTIYIILYFSINFILAQTNAGANSVTPINDNNNAQSSAPESKNNGPTSPTSVAISPTGSTTASAGGDCRAPTIFTACMDRAQLNINTCLGDNACLCKFTREKTLCFDQCKSANAGQKDQLQSEMQSYCNKLSDSDKSSIMKPSSTYSEPTLVASGKAPSGSSKQKKSAGGSGGDDDSSDSRFNAISYVAFIIATFVHFIS